MAAAKTEMLPSALQISDPLGFSYSPMDSYPKLEEMMLLHSTGTPFLTASAPDGVGFGTGEPGDSYNHLTGDTLHDIAIGCEKSVLEQTYSTPRLPSVSYTGRFTLEPATSCSNNLWPEPLYSLVSGLMGMSQPPTSAAPCSSAAPVTSSSHTMSWPIQVGDTSTTYCSVSPDLFPDSNQSFPSPSNSSEFFRIKRNVMDLSTGKSLKKNLVQSAFQQTLGDKFTFQQDNNLKHKAKYTLELHMYQDDSECS